MQCQFVCVLFALAFFRLRIPLRVDPSPFVAVATPAAAASADQSRGGERNGRETKEPEQDHAPPPKKLMVLQAEIVCGQGPDSMFHLVDGAANANTNGAHAVNAANGANGVNGASGSRSGSAGSGSLDGSSDFYFTKKPSVAEMQRAFQHVRQGGCFFLYIKLRASTAPNSKSHANYVFVESERGLASPGSLWAAQVEQLLHRRWNNDEKSVFIQSFTASVVRFGRAKGLILPPRTASKSSNGGGSGPAKRVTPAILHQHKGVAKKPGQKYPGVVVYETTQTTKKALQRHRTATVTISREEAKTTSIGTLVEQALALHPGWIDPDRQWVCWRPKSCTSIKPRICLPLNRFDLHRLYLKCMVGEAAGRCGLNLYIRERFGNMPTGIYLSLAYKRSATGPTRYVRTALLAHHGYQTLPSFCMEGCWHHLQAVKKNGPQAGQRRSVVPSDVQDETKGNRWWYKAPKTVADAPDNDDVLHTITARYTHGHKSLEELRWEQVNARFVERPLPARPVPHSPSLGRMVGDALLPKGGVIPHNLFGRKELRACRVEFRLLPSAAERVPVVTLAQAREAKLCGFTLVKAVEDTYFPALAQFDVPAYVGAIVGRAMSHENDGDMDSSSE